MDGTETTRKSSLKNLATGMTLALGIAVVLSGTTLGCVMDLPPDGPKFDPACRYWSQDEVTDRLRLALTELRAQSLSIRTQYATRENELRLQLIPGGDNTEIQAKMRFSDFVQDTQERIQNYYRRNNVLLARNSAAFRLDILALEIESQIADPCAAELFRARLTTLELLHYISQREFLPPSERAYLETRYRELVDTISGLGGTLLPSSINASTIFVVTRQLRNSLEQHLPDVIGNRELRRGLLQQFEDFAQFDGWINDLTELRFDLTLPRKPRDL